MKLTNDYGQPQSHITVDVTQKYQIDIQISVNGLTGLVPFTAGSGNNYEYEFYLSRSDKTLQYKVGE